MLSLRLFFRGLLVSSALLVGACSDGDDLVSTDQSFNLTGVAANGPLDGATVEVRTPAGTLLGSTQTGAQGDYSLDIGVAPPYRVSTSGGQYNGQAYTGSLTARCEGPITNGSIRCDLTPLSSVVTTLMGRGYNLDEGKALLEQRYGLQDDPFTRELLGGQAVLGDEFDLDAARTAINNGQGLDSWLAAVADWIEDPSSHPAPPGTPRYSIALNSGIGGSGTPDPAAVLMGEQAVFTLIPDAGYDLISATGCDGTLAGNTYTTAVINDVISGNGDCSVTVAFALKRYSVSYAADIGGSIAGTTDQTVPHGGDADPVSAVAETGYSFSQWSDGVTTATRADTSITGDISATAAFALNQYTLTYGAGTGGSISGSSPQTVSHGSDGTTVTAVPDTGYTFSHWSDGVLSASRTDTGVTGNRSVTAQFALNQYTLTYDAGIGGSLTGANPQTVDHGSDGSSVTAVADTGYSFDQWSDGVTTATRTDTNVSGDISVSAGFTLNQYTLTYSAGSNGSISGASPQTVSHGGDGSGVTAVADSGYAFDQWSDGVTTASRTDTGITGDISVNATFVAAVGTPDGVAADGGDSQATISWNPVSGADSYTLYYATDSSISPDNYASLANGTRVTGVTSSHTVNGLSNGTTWYFIVTAVQGGVEGSAGTTVSATPEATLTPWLTRLHDGRLQVDVRGPTKAIINWPTAGGETYNLFVTEDPATDLNNYAAYGATLQTGVSPGYTLNGLSTDQPVYVALEVNGTVTDWTALRSATWGTNTSVTSQAVDEGGNRYVGGSFTAVIRNTGAGVILPPASGTSPQDHGLGSPRINGTVSTAVEDGRGGWYIGGLFTRVGGLARSNLAHIDAQGRVTAWNPGANYHVSTLAVSGNTVYAGGGFTAAGGGTGTTPRSRLAAFDDAGNLLAWNPGANSSVRALAVSGSVIYAAGMFSAAGGGTGTTTRSHLAAFDDAGNLLPWNPRANSYVSALAVAGGTVYVGGGFTAVGGGTSATLRNRLAAFDDAGNALPWNPGANNTVWTLAVSGGTVYVGGGFTAAGGGTSTTPRNRLAAFDDVGNLLPWNPGADNTVQTLAVSGDIVYAGGVFTAVGGGTGNTVRNHLAAFDGAGNPLPWNPGADNPARSLAVSGDIVFSGGAFTAAGGGTGTTVRNYLAAFDEAGNLLPWNPGANDYVKALVVSGSTIYAGGSFTAAGGGTGTTTRNYLAAFDRAGDLLAWNPGANGEVRALAVSGGTVYAGGVFYSAGGGTGTTMRYRLAAFDDVGNLLAWNPGANSYVQALAVSGSTVYAGGGFTAAGGGMGTTTRNYLAAFDEAGNLLPWNPGANSLVFDLAVSGATVYAGGAFTAAGGGTGSTTRNRLAAFDGTGNLMAWNPSANNYVYSLAVSGGTVYAGGSFTAVGVGTDSTPRNRLVSFDEQGKLLPWNPGVNNNVKTLAVSADIFYVGGGFTEADGGAYNRLRSRLVAFDEAGGLLER